MTTLPKKKVKTSQIPFVKEQIIEEPPQQPEEVSEADIEEALERNDSEQENELGEDGAEGHRGHDKFYDQARKLQLYQGKPAANQKPKSNMEPAEVAPKTFKKKKEVVEERKKEPFSGLPKIREVDKKGQVIYEFMTDQGVVGEECLPFNRVVSKKTNSGYLLELQVAKKGEKEGKSGSGEAYVQAKLELYYNVYGVFPATAYKSVPWIPKLCSYVSDYCNLVKEK